MHPPPHRLVFLIVNADEWRRGEGPRPWKQASVWMTGLNIAFWVISSVGAEGPLLPHIIYVSVRARWLSLHAPPHPNTISFSLEHTVPLIQPPLPPLIHFPPSVSSLSSLFHPFFPEQLPWLFFSRLALYSLFSLQPPPHFIHYATLISCLNNPAQRVLNVCRANLHERVISICSSCHDEEERRR